MRTPTTRGTARRVGVVQAAVKSAVSRPKAALKLLGSFERGRALAESWPSVDVRSPASEAACDNPLREYFEANGTGPGIVKWTHYFDAYQRHLAKFVGSPVNVVEVGVYAGGSLQMWRSYLGEESHVYGIDIQPACRVYATEGISVFIGDQADRSFWSGFRGEVPDVDVVIDDGGHTAEQQMVTLEEMLPHLRAGGVYICEDVLELNNRFATFAAAFVDELNRLGEPAGSIDRRTASEFQRAIHSIHFYPFMTVIEKHAASPTVLESERRGTEWQPFGDR